MIKFSKLRFLFLALIISFVSQQLTAQSTEKPAPAESSIAERPLVVCLGDSLTARGYPQVMETVLHVRVVNAGIGGNTSRQGLARLQKDVLSKKPDVVVFF